MPRAFLKTKNRGGHHTYTCTRCGEPIEAGQTYYTWKFNRGGRFYQHGEHGYPKPSQLSNSKIAVLLDAVQEADLGSCETVEDMKAVLADVANSAREVAQEYADSADNIESSWPSGNPTSEACRETSENLEGYAEDLESWDPGDDFDEGAAIEQARTEWDDDNPDAMGDAEGIDALVEQYREEWVDEKREEAQSLMDEHPEYSG